MTIVWREQLRVGNDIIDDDHRNLIDNINRIGESLKEDEPSSLKLELQNLYDYSLLHFKREEKIAFAVGYENAPNLHLSHQMLLERLETIRHAFVDSERARSLQLRKEFHEFLRNWLIDHIIKEDFLLKPVLEKHAPSFAPEQG